MTFRNVLVPFDGSEQALKALEVGAGLANAGQVKLHILNVAEYVPVPGEPTDAVFMIDQGITQLQGLTMKKAEYLVKKHKVKAQLVAKKGHPADEILKYAKKERCDLIIMGNRGASGLNRFLLGSVSDSVAHHAHCAVLIVK